MQGKPYETSPYVPEGKLSRTTENALHLRSRKSLEDAAEAGIILEAPCTMCDCTSMRFQ